MSNDIGTRKLLSVISHGSIFLGSLLVPVIIPIVVLLISNDPVVQQNSREAVNFYINLFIYGIVIAVLAISVIGIPIAIILGVLVVLASFILPIIAMLEVISRPDIPYRYPYIWHLLP